MFFHKVGNNWIIELKYNYKFQDLLDYNYDIYKELLENDDLYKSVISKFCLDEPFLVNVLENKDDTLLLFTINKKDLEDKLVIKDEKNKQRYLALIGKSKREEFDLCLLYDDKNEEIKISQVIDYLRQPDLAEKISKNNGYILGVSIIKLYKALEEKGFLDDNNRLEMASSVEIDSLKESYFHLKKILTITKKDKVKKRLAVLRKKINKKLEKTLDSEINESNREYHNFLMYKDLKREDISLIKSNLEILRRACLYYIPIVDNVYLDKVLKEYDRLTLIERGKTPSKDELERVMIARHTPNVHNKLKAGKVAVLGLGGLGSNIAISLSRVGVGEIILVDYDVVEPSNLNRQQYFVKHIGMKKTDALKSIIDEINPFVKIKTKDIFVTKENIDFLKEYDIVIEAFDDPKNKATLCNTVLRNFKDKYLIASSGLAGY